METIQIVAQCDNGANLLWDEQKRDFVDFANEVPQTDIDSLPIAKNKAKEFEGIMSVWCEVIDTETGYLIETIK